MLIGVVASFPRRRVSWQVSRVRARLRRGVLQEALADGENPWETPELMLCAADLTSQTTRHKLAWAVDGLLRLAEQGRSVSPYVRLQRRAVLEERETLSEVAEQLRAPAPVSVAGVALVARFLSAPSSPLFDSDDERARAAIHDTVTRCSRALTPACPTPP